MSLPASFTVFYPTFYKTLTPKEYLQLSLKTLDQMKINQGLLKKLSLLSIPAMVLSKALCVVAEDSDPNSRFSKFSGGMSKIMSRICFLSSGLFFLITLHTIPTLERRIQWLQNALPAS